MKPRPAAARRFLSGEALVPLLLLLFAGSYVAATAGLPLLGKTFPWIVLAGLVAGAAWILWEQLRPDDAGDEPRPLPRRFLPVLLATAAFVAAAQLLGLLASGFAFVAVTGIVLGARPRAAVLQAAVLALALYLLFTLGLGQRL